MSFAFDLAPIGLPAGAWAATHRRLLHHDGRPLLGLTQGAMRACVYPVFTPAGFPVTSEAPADHPHHQSLWVAADHVHAHVPAAEGREEAYTYNFYVNDTFQGRAPGHIVEQEARGRSLGGDVFELAQRLHWRGPPEWAAPQGRVILEESRRLRVRVDGACVAIHLCTTLAPVEWDVSIGPTRHALLNARVSEAISLDPARQLVDDAGRPWPGPTSGVSTPTRWLDFTGAVGGGHTAGLALVPLPRGEDGWWFATDWGVMTWSPVRDCAVRIARGATATYQACCIAHDGPLPPDAIDALVRRTLAATTSVPDPP